MTDLESLLACPRCEGALRDLRCPACRVDYPRLAGMPWLFADPSAAVADWRNRWHLAVARLQADLNEVEQAAVHARHPATRARLAVLTAGYRAQQTHIARILEPLRLAEGGGSLETLLALRTRLPAAQGMFSYEANVHRDWNWGEAENRASRLVVMQALEGAEPARVLVLGAGAGRLAYDLHRHGSAALTVALDLNPLLACVGDRVSRGESLHLVEFPLAPRTPEAAAVERTLRAPAPARPGLHFVLADALRAPFAPASFDAVITPWLLDVIDADADATLGCINRLLRADGVWVHHGSVAFDHPDSAQRLTLAELEAVASEAGFGDLQCREDHLPYMNCPDSRHGRVEWVVTLRGRKTAEAPGCRPLLGLPDWIADGRSPVPALPAFQTQALTTRIHAYIMSLIDGKRTLEDMARILEEQRLMPRQEAASALRGFLMKMHDEARRAPP